MPEPEGSVYGAGARLMESSAGTAQSIGQQDVERKKIAAEQSMSSEKETGADIRQISSQQADMALKKLDMQTKSMNVTPQIAVGLARYMGPAAFQLIGPQDPHFVLGLLHAQVQQDMAKLKAPKEFNFRVGDKTVPGVMHYNEDTSSWEIKQLGEGGTVGTPEGRGGKGKGGGDDTFKKNKEFMRSYEKDEAILNDPTKSAQLKASSPDEFAVIQDRVSKNRDRYDQLKTDLGSAGGAPKPAAGGGGAATPDNSPFDADAFIKDALGDGGSRGGL
jgi:hypothetical protein